MRDQQRARRRRHHRRDDRHQPAAERRVGLDVVLGEHQERDAHRGEQAAECARGPQHPVQVDGDTLADEVPADQHRPGADRHQCHRRRAVEVGHLRVAGVPARHGRVAQPVTPDHDDQHHQQHGGDHPDHLGERPQPGHVDRQGGAGDGDDPGAHHRGEPVGPDVAQHLDAGVDFAVRAFRSLSVAIARQPTGKDARRCRDSRDAPENGRRASNAVWRQGFDP